MSKRGQIGKVYLMPDSEMPATVAPNTYLLKLDNSSIINRYLYYYLSSHLGYRQLKRRDASTTIGAIYKNDLKEIEFPLPPLPEQRKIVSVLRTVDQAIQKCEEIISKISDVKKATKQDILYNGIDSKNKEETAIGELPEKWEIEKIQSICKINPEGFSEQDTTGETFEYISLSDVSEGDIIQSQSLLTKDAPSRAQRTVRTGDVLVGTVRPKQRSHSVITDEYDGMICSSGFGVLRTSAELDPKFLLQEVLSHRFFRQMEAYVAGSGYPAIKIGDLKKIRVPIPPLDTQNKVADILRSIDETRTKEKRYKSQLQRFKQGLMQDLLSGEVRTIDTDIDVTDKITQHG